METDSYVYDAFGAVTSSTGSTSNDWLFTGEQNDGETDLYFLRARYYDPETGRFLGRDPIEFAQRYAYAGNNPIVYTDPSGLEGEGSYGSCYVPRTPMAAEFAAVGARCSPGNAAAELRSNVVSTGAEIGKNVLAGTPLPIDSVPVNALLLHGLQLGENCARSETLDGITFHYGCRGVAESFLLRVDNTAFVLGTDVFTYEYAMTEKLMRHEACHVGQYDNYGNSFLRVYTLRSAEMEAAADWVEDNPMALSTARLVCSGSAS